MWPAVVCPISIIVAHFQAKSKEHEVRVVHVQLGNDMTGHETSLFSSTQIRHSSAVSLFIFELGGCLANRQLLFIRTQYIFLVQEDTLELTWLLLARSLRFMHSPELWSSSLAQTTDWKYMHWNVTTSITCILTVINHNMMKFWGSVCASTKTARTYSVSCASWAKQPTFTSSLHLINAIYFQTRFQYSFPCWLCRLACWSPDWVDENFHVSRVDYTSIK